MRRVRWSVVVPVVLVTGVVVVLASRLRPPAYEAPPPTFDGSSEKLKQTAVLPTLDTPIAEGSSAFWCSTFGVAWRKMATDVAHGPLRVEGAEEIAGRLNRVADPEGDLPAGAYYAAAGWARDGIVQRILADMKAKFPAAKPPDLSTAAGSGAVVSYAYLNAGLRFDKPYIENDQPLQFRGAGGETTPVTSFGLRKKDVDASYRELRDQAELLYVSGDSLMQPGEYAIDLCKTSKDVQVVVALIPRKATLAEAIAYLGKKQAEVGSDQRGPRLGPNDTLLVPNLTWRLEHHFKELEGHMLLNVGMPIVEASQTVAFHLDRSGAGVESEAKLVATATPVQFVFDRPFLILLKKRGAKEPFFAMWVDNAELLSPWKQAK